MMSQESSYLLLMATGDDANERLSDFLTSDSYAIVDLTTGFSKGQLGKGAGDEDHQVVLFSNMPLPAMGEDAMNSCLEFMHDLGIMAESRGLTINTLLHTQPMLAQMPDGMFVGLLLPGPPSFSHSQHQNLEELSLVVRDVLECQRLKEATRQKPLLERLMESSAALLSENNRQDVLRRILQVVRESGFDRVRLYLLSDDEQMLRGVAHAGMNDSHFDGVEWPVATDCHLRKLLTERKPLILKPVSGEPKHSEERLAKEGLDEWVSVPLSLRGKVIGQLSADNKFSRRPISEQELEPLKLFADLAAAAIEKAELIEKAERRTKELEALQRTTHAVTSAPSLERPTLLRTIIAQAVELLQARSGGLYEYHSERGELVLVEDHNRQDFTGKILKVGEGFAGKLVLSGDSYRIAGNYNEHPDRAVIFENQRHFEAVLEVPLRSQEQVIGVLYVDDEKGREFTAEDAQLLALFANQAAIELVKQGLLAQDEEKLRRLEKLSHSTTEIMSNLGKVKRHELLALVARRATEILAAETCGISLVNEQEVLSLEAFHGQPDGSVKRGQIFQIVNGNQTGLSGHIAYHGKLFNSFGEELARHPAIRRTHRFTTPSGKYYSVLAIPLLDNRGNLVGLLRADNKLGEDGFPHDKLKFTKEDEWVMQIYAEVVAVCVQNSGLVEQLRNQKEHLIDNLPHAVIAIDKKGYITDFSGQAERILGYRKDDVVGRHVRILYQDGEPNLIGKLLKDSKDGKVHNVKAVVRSNTGELIPVELSASNLYDEEGNRIGSIGYFEDVRLLKEYQHRLELILRASDLVAKADDLSTGLQSLAGMLVSLFPGNFCLISLFDESGDSLIAEAGDSQPSPISDATEWKPPIGRRYNVADYPGLLEMLQTSRTPKLKYSQEHHRETLRQIQLAIDLPQQIQSLLMIPLRLGNRLLGLLSLAESCSETQSQFTKKENIELAAGIASQTTILVDRIRSAERRARENAQELQHLERLRIVSDALARVTEPAKVPQQILSSAKEILQADAVILWLFDDERSMFLPELSCSQALDQELWAKYQSQGPNNHGTAHWVLEKQIWYAVNDRNDLQLGPLTRALLAEFGAKAFQGVALRVGAEKLGVIYALYRKPVKFVDRDRRTALGFARNAALTLKKARLTGQISATNKAAKAVAKSIVFEDRQATLRSIVEEAKKASRCEAVVLYEYEHDKQEIRPPIFRGVNHHKKLFDPEKGWEHPLVLKLLDGAVRRVVDDLTKDHDFKDRSFAREEKIMSCIAIPLLASGQKVGVMFFNYRRNRRFTTEEVENVQFFADQAAVAIRFSQFSEDKARKFYQQSSLLTLSKKLRNESGLQRTMDAAVKHTAQLMGVECCNIVLPNANGELIPRAHTGWPEEMVANLKLAKDYGSQSGFTMKRRAPVFVDGYSEEKQFDFPDVVMRRGIKSGLSVPMMRGEEVIGAMLVYSTTPRHFSEEDCYLLQLIAEQTAIAIRSTERYEQLQRRNNHFQAIHNASKAITNSFGRERDVLDEIVRQAVEGLTEAGSSKVAVGTIQLYNETENTLMMTSIYPAEKFPDLSKRVNDVWSLDEFAGIIGIAGRAVLEGRSQRADDVSQNNDYLRFNKETRSELAVPMWDGDRVIGAINVESHQLNGFDDDDQETLKTLAEHAVIAIKNARQFEELKDSKLQIGARTALAWMGMANNAWRHVIARDASEIGNRATLIRELSKKNGFDPRRISKHLEQIESLVKSIHEKPITAPLSSEEGVTMVNINDLVIERLNQLRQNDRYSSTKLEVLASQHKNLTVQISSEWLRRALDILVDNAADAVKPFGAERRLITVTTELLNSGEVKICVADRGPGIPEEIKSLLFKTRIEQSKGFGMGLLIAQAIVETYGGKIELEDSNEQGAKMTIRLPHKP